MEKDIKSYLNKILLISLLTIAIGISIDILSAKEIDYFFFLGLISFFGVFYFFTHIQIKKRVQQKNFGMVYMVYSMIKLLIFLSTMGLLIYLDRGKIVFTVSFMLYLYTVFTVNDIISIMSYIKKSTTN